MLNTDLEREYLTDFAYIRIQKEIEEWQEFEQKEAKIVVTGPSFKKVYSSQRKLRKRKQLQYDTEN